MKRIIINGGRRLRGEVSVGGSKNAALPIIFACILTNGVSEIENLPDIGDVRVALSLIESLGAVVEKRGNVTFVDTRTLAYRDPDPRLVSMIRASTYLLGTLVSRFGKCPILAFGGCSFSARPIDMHIDACRSLGGRLDGDILLADRLRGGEIFFNKLSVGATVNAILLAASAEGKTLIHGCAIEPHIDALIDFLNSCGGSISRCGRDIAIEGRELRGGKTGIIGDMIEAGSYLALSFISGGGIIVKNSPDSDMTSVYDAFHRIGAKILPSDNGVSAVPDSPKPLSITTAPYPGFPTDLQPLMAPLMAVCSGGEISDTVWPGRTGYLKALSNFGIRHAILDDRVEIFRSKIQNGIATAPDLRGGMACLITALSAPGRSEIYSPHIIQRGYEKLEQKLICLGADVKIEYT